MKAPWSALLASLLASLAVAKPPADLQQKLDTFTTGTLGGVSAVWVDRDGVAYFQSGRIERDDPRTITPETPYEIGSVTKVFTSLLLAESVRAGRVSLADPAAKYLLPPDDAAQKELAKITLLSLATHSSGLPRMPQNMAGATSPSDPYATYDRARLVAALRTHGPSARTGHGVAYSNFGVAVLGEALAAAWGTTYAEALKTHVLTPLGLAQTTVGLSDAPAPAGLAPGHVLGRTVPNWTFQAFAPAGAVRSTAHDMGLWLQACVGLTETPLREAITLTVTPRREAAEFGGHIGLGWLMNETTGTTLLWHNGATAGSHTFVAFNPTTATGVAILANIQKPSEGLGFGLLGGKPPKPKPKAVANATDYLGRYPLNPAFALTITESGGVLRGQGTGQPAIPLEPTGRDTFEVGEVAAEIIFERGADGTVTALTLRQNGVDQRGLRGPLPPPPQTLTLPRETLVEYVGSYPLAPTFVLEVTEGDGTLFVQATGQPKFPVFATARDEFLYRVVDARLSFQRDPAGKVTGVILHQNGRDMPATKN